MKIYFLSSKSCVLFLNGAYFGITDRFLRFARLHPADRIYAQFSPEGALPIGCFLTEELRFSPPEGFEVYLLKDGLALYARDFPPADRLLKTIAQARDKDCLATVFSQGEVQLSLQTHESFFNATLPPSFCVCKAFFQENLLFLESEKQLAVYSKSGKRLFLEEVLSYEITNGVLQAKLPLHEGLGRIAECEWELSENELIRKKFVLFSPEETPENGAALLPYAFFESVLIGANYEEFLTDELRAKANDIRSFLGDYQSVLPTDDPKRIGLIKKKADRVFSVVYYTVVLENGKIADITT